MFWWLMKKIEFWLWAGWVASYLQRSLSAHVNGGVQMPPLTAENSHFLRSGAQEVALVMIIIFMMCRFNEYTGFTWSSCHAGDVRSLLDGCYERWFVYVKQRTASRWSLRAGGTCWERVSLTWIPIGTECWLLINQIREISWCSDLSLCGKNESTFCAANLQVVTRNLVWWAPWELPILVTGSGGVCPTISVKNLGDVIQNCHV